MRVGSAKESDPVKDFNETVPRRNILKGVRNSNCLHDRITCSFDSRCDALLLVGFTFHMNYITDSFFFCHLI